MRSALCRSRLSACSLWSSTRCTFAPWTSPLGIFTLSPPVRCRVVLCTFPACTDPRSNFPRCTFTLCTLPLCLSARCTLAFGAPAVRHRRFRLSSENAPTIVAAVRTFFTFAAHALLARSARLATIAAQRPKSAVGEAAGLGRKGYGVLPCGRATAGAAPRGDGHLPADFLTFAAHALLPR